jgi:ATP-dependent DNA helicase PIF1
LVDIPFDLLVPEFTNSVGDIVGCIYPDLLKNMYVDDFFGDRAILAPTLEVVEEINDYVLSLIPGDFKEYLSCDTVLKIDGNSTLDHRWITSEFLNDIKCSGLPNHKLIIKVGVPIMLLRNIDVSSGLCNGTRLTVTYLGVNVIGAKIVTGNNIGAVVYIPRMKLLP